MPSCVIKLCKNNSHTNIKSQGITFHRFPKNEEQHFHWTNIVRKSRNQNEWKPSKSSVVCSSHFDPDDLYTTEKGLIRVIASAVPSLLLKQPPNNQQQCAVKPNINRPLQVLIKLEQPSTKQQPAEKPHLAEPSHQLIKLEQPWTQQQPAEEPNLNQHFQVLIELEPRTQEQPAEEPNLNRPLQTLIKLEQPWIQEQPAAEETYLNRPLQRIIGLEQPSTDNVVEQPLPTFPRIEYLQKIIKQKEEIIRKKNRTIKTLSRKVRRFQDRNKALKHILETLKTKFFIDMDLFEQLNGDIVAVNLFNSYNRKKLKSKMKYSPGFIKFCQTLNSYSPKAYEYVRDSFETCLPHPKTLAKWCRDLNGGPGLAGESLQPCPHDESIE